MPVEHTREALTRRALPANFAPAIGAEEGTIWKRCPTRRAFSFTETNAGKALFGEKPSLENIYIEAIRFIALFGLLISEQAQ